MEQNSCVNDDMNEVISRTKMEREQKKEKQ